jgi:hypothetical protein
MSASDWWHSETSPSGSGSSINQHHHLYLVSVALNLKLYLLNCMWKFVTRLTQIGTHWYNSRQRNCFLFTHQLAFKRICEWQNYCFLDTQCNWKVVKPDLQGQYCKKRNVHTLSEWSDCIANKQNTFLHRVNTGVKNENKCGVAKNNTNWMITYPNACK